VKLMFFIIDKAAQAAAQAARAASLEAHFKTQAHTLSGQTQPTNGINLNSAQAQPPRSITPRTMDSIVTLLQSKGVDVHNGDFVDGLRRMVDPMQRSANSSGSGSPSSTRGDAFIADPFSRQSSDMLRNRFSPDFILQERTSSFQGNPIQRPTEAAARPFRSDDHDIQDLNGTLASLGIDNHTSSWAIEDNKKAAVDRI
jgi:hypothetical protein